jgi:hypothetical protein
LNKKYILKNMYKKCLYAHNVHFSIRNYKLNTITNG